MNIIFKLWREQPGQAPRFQDYPLTVGTGDTVLDALLRIQGEQDGSIAFRKNCRNTICGSCAMRINGRSTLACKENCIQEVERLDRHGILQTVDIEGEKHPVITVAPLGNLKVMKDLVVDMNPFWEGIKAVDPYVSTASRQIPEREFLQTPQERAKLDQTGNCILCGACYSECNVLETNPTFVGPHALAKAYRTLADSRDDRTPERIAQYNSTAGVWGCTRCYNCNTACPMEVAPLDHISKIKSAILQRTTADDSRAIRHRKVLVNLVKSGGWVDERKFGIQVVSHSFRDLRGLLSLVPLGLRMLASRKFPLTFEPSEGQPQVKALIEAVQRETNP
jgi:succinate dehydrogenase / fumarate reductase iron-sulfur subunit